MEIHIHNLQLSENQSCDLEKWCPILVLKNTTANAAFSLTYTSLPAITYITYPVVLFLVLLFGCNPVSTDKNILLITDVEGVHEKWTAELQSYLAGKFGHVQIGDLYTIDEDTLQSFACLYLYQLPLDRITPQQYNVLDRYILAGGKCIGVYPTIKPKDRFRSQIFAPAVVDEGLENSTYRNQCRTIKYDTGDSLLHTGRMIDELLHGYNGLNYQTLNLGKRPPAYTFDVDTLLISMNEPIEFEVLPNADVLFIERGGKIGLVKHKTRNKITLANLPVISTQSNGLNGLALAPDFEISRSIFLSYLPNDRSAYQRISRMIMVGDSLDLSSEIIIMETPLEFEYGWHGTNALEFDKQGNLYIGMGDFTLQSSEVAGYAQIDEQWGHSQHDAQRTSANSSNYPGKILRVFPSDTGGYTIPDDNLFDRVTDSSRGEIYVMGCRNPYRFVIDPYSDALYFGDVGPDAWDDGEKGPRGYDELNVVRKPGFYGWPYFVADNKAYRDFDYATQVVGSYFDPADLYNNSPNNTGMRRLPLAMKPVLWYHKGSTDEFPYLGSGGMNIMVGPKYYFRDYSDQVNPFPVYFDEKLFIYDWVRNWILLITLTTNDNLVQVEPFLAHQTFNKIMDMKFGLDGALYLLEYGSQGYHANKDAAIKRISYAPGNPKPDSFVELSDRSGLFENMLPIKTGVEQGRHLLMDQICLSCHRVDEKIIGPSFTQISTKYSQDQKSINYLSQKIIEGGTGNWPGNIIMPANSNVSLVEAHEMVKYILSF